MGKARKQKTRWGANNPLSIISAPRDSDDDLEYQNSQATGPIAAIREQLLNFNVEEKINGLQSLAIFAGSKDKIASICESDVIRIAAPLLCDPNDQAVRNAAAGTLRNLSVCGPAVCEFLVDSDILTPLLSLLVEYIQNAQWTPTFDASMHGQIDLYSDIFLQSINLLWNLCESATVALDVFNQTHLLEGLLRCLDYKVYGLDIAISVAQCFLVVSENNPKSWNVISQNVNIFLALLSINDGNGQKFLCALVAGIISNVPALSSAYASKLFASFTCILEINHMELLASLPTWDRVNQVPEIEINMDTTDDETEEEAALRRRRQELPTENDLAAQDISYLLDAQRVSVEVITNLCATEEEWLDTEDDDVSENESVTDFEVTNLDQNEVKDKVSIDVLEVIKSTNLVYKIWQKAQPLSDSIVHLLRKTSIGLLHKAKNLRISSLLCLQNLYNILNSEDLGGAGNIYNVWVELGQQVFRGPQDVSLLEPSTSLMRSALGHLKGSKDHFVELSISDLELMLNGVRNCSMAEIRANWLRMLGTLGCLLSEDLAKTIITFITETCTKEEDVWTISEALDALMDMFSENDWNKIVVELNLPTTLKNLEQILKTKKRQQKAELMERYPAVQTVQLNLARFIKYIAKISVE